MGQKVHPLGFRLGITKTWCSRWYRDKDYAQQLHQDFYLRDYVAKRLENAGISKIELERAAKRVKINVHSARPGLVIGKKGRDIEDLKAELRQVVGREVTVNIIEIRKPDLDAQLLAESVATQLQRRVSFRRALKDALNKSMRMGAEGVKVAISGRLGGADIARTEWAREGRVPLHTLRAQISYGTARANTTYGVIGVKCWVYTGDAEKIHSTTLEEERANDGDETAARI